MHYGDIPWLLLAGGLTVLGLLGSWAAYRRRGLASGMRGVAWSLVPIALYLTQCIHLFWDIGYSISKWASGFVFHQSVWAGLAVFGLSVVLYITAGAMRSRGAGGAKAKAASAADNRAPLPGAAAPAKAVERSKGGKAKGDVDPDLADIEAILKRRGIS